MAHESETSQGLGLGDEWEDIPAGEGDGELADFGTLMNADDFEDQPPTARADRSQSEGHQPEDEETEETDEASADPDPLADFDRLTPGQRIKRARQMAINNPELTVQGLLLLSQGRTGEAPADDELRREVRGLRQQIESLSRAPEKPASSAPEVPVLDPAAPIMAWAAEFERVNHRPPTNMEAQAWIARQEVAPIQAEMRNMIQETQFRAAEAQYDALVKEFPAAEDNERALAVANFLRENVTGRGQSIQPGDVRKAYMYLYGDEELEKLRGRETTARAVQRERAQRAPSVPPAAARESGGPPVTGTSNLDEIANRQKASGKLNRLRGQ